MLRRGRRLEVGSWWYALVVVVAHGRVVSLFGLTTFAPSVHSRGTTFCFEQETRRRDKRDKLGMCLSGKVHAVVFATVTSGWRQ